MEQEKAANEAKSGVVRRKMGRPRVKEEAKRTVRMAMALTEAEAVLIDRARGSMDRGRWLRWVALRAAKDPMPSAGVESWDWEVDTP